MAPKGKDFVNGDLVPRADSGDIPGSGAAGGIDRRTAPAAHPLGRFLRETDAARPLRAAAARAPSRQGDVCKRCERDPSQPGAGGSRSVPACEECRPVNPKPRPGAAKPFCMNCGRELVELPLPGAQGWRKRVGADPVSRSPRRAPRAGGRDRGARRNRSPDRGGRCRSD